MSAPRAIVTVPEIRPLVQALYDRHGAGCCLHLVLDDGNISDSNVRFCIEYALREGHDDCMLLGGLLFLASPTQRRKLYEWG